MFRSMSTNKQVSFPTLDQHTPVNIGATRVAEPINTEGFIEQFFLAADRSGTSTNDNVYARECFAIRFYRWQRRDVRRSTDGGNTFSAPRRINDDPVNHAKWHWFGTLSSRGAVESMSSGTIRITLRQRHFAALLFFQHRWRNTWSPNVAVSNPFNPFIGYPNQSKIGDYITVVSDDDSANVAYAATFNGEEDIYYVRIRPALPPSDFNGDARPDLLLFNAGTRQTAVWYMNNNVRIGNANGPTLPGGWSLASVADFNRDSYPDYLLFNSVTRATVIWYMNNNFALTANLARRFRVGGAFRLWQTSTGTGIPIMFCSMRTRVDSVWYMRNNARIGSAAGPALPGGRIWLVSPISTGIIIPISAV